MLHMIALVFNMPHAEFLDFDELKGSSFDDEEDN